jgi:hypothetical protein
MRAARFVGAKANFNGNALAAQALMPLPGDFRIGIFDGGNDTLDAGLDDGVGARRRLAVMRTWLQRHIERRAMRGALRLLERLDFGMRTAAGLSPAATTPSFTITAPTAGLGQVLPSPRRPSESASAI